MQPLKITCKPQALFTYDRFFHLDGLLARAVLIEKLGEDFYNLPTVTRNTPIDKIMLAELPLERRERNKQWYWACSWADTRLQMTTYSLSGWVRSYPKNDQTHFIAGKKQTYDAKAGADKPYNMPVRLTSAPELTWFAVGDGDEIRRLLNDHYDAIGKKTAMGNGQLEYYSDGTLWQVTQCAKDYSERDENDNLTRALPIDKTFDLGGNIELVGIRPPYHAAINMFLCEVPK